MASRRNRKRKTTHREPNGRLQRPPRGESADEVRSVAVEARQRVYGLSEPDAKTVDGGDIIGHLYLSKQITRLQLQACRKFEEVMRDLQWAVLIRPEKSPSDLNRSGGHDSSDGTDPEYVAKVDRAKGRYHRALRAVISTYDSMAWMAILGWVMDGKEMWSQIGSLRIAANAVAHEFGAELQDEEKAA